MAVVRWEASLAALPLLAAPSFLGYLVLATLPPSTIESTATLVVGLSLLSWAVPLVWLYLVDYALRESPENMEIKVGLAAGRIVFGGALASWALSYGLTPYVFLYTPLAAHLTLLFPGVAFYFLASEGGGSRKLATASFLLCLSATLAWSASFLLTVGTAAPFTPLAAVTTAFLGLAGLATASISLAARIHR